MRSKFNTFIVITAIALAIPSLANARGYKTTVETPLTTSVNVEVVMSEEMQHRANNLASKGRGRNIGATRGVKKGFARNGYYGDRELEILSNSLEETITRRFTKKGLIVSQNAPVTLRITLETVKNNRPTSEQLRLDPSLSFQSYALGGAEVSAELIGQNGSSLGTMHYEYFETNMRQDQQFVSTWSEAEHTFGRFARKAAKTLTN